LAEEEAVTAAPQPASKATAAPANGNGNGNGVLGDEDEDEAEDEEEDELDEEEDNEAELEADESNSSNGIVRDSKLQQLAANKAVDAVSPVAAGADSAPAIGQKRTALHCDMELKNAGGVGVGVGEKSPDLKKLRSE